MHRKFHHERERERQGERGRNKQQQKKRTHTHTHTMNAINPRYRTKFRENVNKLQMCIEHEDGSEINSKSIYVKRN